MHKIRNRLSLIALSGVFLMGIVGTVWGGDDTSKQETGPALAQVFPLIYTGDFAKAHELVTTLEDTNALGQPWAAVQGILGQYQELSARREKGREASYAKHHQRLERLRQEWTTYRADPNYAPEDPNDPNSIDPNDFTNLLAVMANVSEFATEEGRNALLADRFVQEVFEASAKRAGQYETKGKWLEAYSSCYAWLKAIDPNNESYKEYAEEMLEKATIALSFEDSPCETSQQRYEGVRKRTFATAIHILSVHYVNPINFKEMADKALNRCKLLGEVVAVLPWDKILSKSEEADVTPPSSQALSAWAVTLAGLQDELEDEVTGLNDRGFLEIFEKVLEMNRSTAELPESIVITQFAEASLGTLDPHTNIIWPRQVEDFDKAMTNEFTGIGIEISKPKGKLTVGSLLLDTPAYKAGLDAGDVIAEVDDVPTKDMSLHCAVKKITGPKGTEVKLKIIREKQEKPMLVTLERDRITVPTIRGWQRTDKGQWRHMVDEENKIAYVRVTSFSGETAEDLEDVMVDLERQGMKALILDLRWNSGGLLSAAVSIVDKFIRGGLVVWTQPGYGKMPDYQLAHEDGTHPNYPVVVLVNSSSASASEIVAGALSDDKYERAVLVGDRTHGKGSVQVITDYRLGGAHLKYTMAYYHLPSGQRVNSRDAMEKEGRKDWGVGADVVVKMRSDEYSDMYKVQKSNEVLEQSKGLGVNDPNDGRHTIAETLAVDPQLEVGLLIAQAKLAQDNELKWTKN